MDKVEFLNETRALGALACANASDSEIAYEREWVRTGAGAAEDVDDNDAVVEDGHCWGLTRSSLKSDLGLEAG